MKKGEGMERRGGGGTGEGERVRRRGRKTDRQTERA